MKCMISVKDFKYRTFGLRQEWLHDFLNKGFDFFEDNSLGPKQIEAFVYYLRDSELIDKKKNLTPLFHILRSVYFKEGINSQILWGIVWINLCFNTYLYRWWITLPTGSYSREELLNKLIVSYGKSNKHVRNAFSSIKETLTKSQIGELLGQGLPDKKGRIIKEISKPGCKSLPPVLILYNLYKLAEKEGIYKFNLQEIEDMIFSPQKIFAICSQDLEKSLFKSSEFDSFYRISIEGNKSYVCLFKEISSIDILKEYVGGRNNEV